MLKKTQINQIHRDAGGKMVDFGGWEMPLHYGSQLKEHLQVRQSAGVFDVSHMTVVDVSGTGCLDFLRHLLANNIDTIQPGQALYSLMLNQSGGVIDDLIAYLRSSDACRLVVNCATREKDLAWLHKQAQPHAVDVCVRDDLGILAIQGPKARALCHANVSDVSMSALPAFRFIEQGDWMIAATGYTGEDGVEVILPNADIEALWRGLLAEGAAPIGLGARDTLRLEAGYCLYGQEMDENTLPWSANLGWTLGLRDTARDFIGRSAVESAQQDQELPRLVGLVLEGRGILRGGQTVVLEDGGQGRITSGGYGPSLEKSIALARVPMSVSSRCEVVIRGKSLAARITKPAFVRNGKHLV